VRDFEQRLSTPFAFNLEANQSVPRPSMPAVFTLRNKKVGAKIVKINVLSGGDLHNSQILKEGEMSKGNTLRG
jgi:hypothetical protein